MNLALWLKKNGFRADQVQTFLPQPHGHGHGHVPLGQNLPGIISRLETKGERVDIVRGERRRLPAQGLPALPRRQQLAAAARGL